MSAIIMKMSYPSSEDNPVNYQIVYNEKEKKHCINSMKYLAKQHAQKTNEPQVLKLDFIYPDDVETVYLKAL